MSTIKNLAFKRPKIALIFAGGTRLKIGARYFSVEKKGDVPKWLAALPELKIIADLHSWFLFGDRQAHFLSVKHWQQIADLIYQQYLKFDGFVVLHNLETINLPASALAFVFGPLPRPIIFTGSVERSDFKITKNKQPFDYGAFSLQTNLLNAIQAACGFWPEVAVVSGNLLLRATKLRLAEALTVDFTANQVLGRADQLLTVSRPIKNYRFKRPLFQPQLSEQVICWQHFPWNTDQFIRQAQNVKVKALIINSFKPVDLLHSQSNVFTGLKAKKVMVVFNQKPPKEYYNKYSNVRFFNALPLEILQIKLIWLLGQKLSLPQRQKLLGVNLKNELLKT